jgi:hypothetical protein
MSFFPLRVGPGRVFEMRARRRYGCAQGHVQFAVNGEARFYLKVALQNSQKV